MACGHLGACVPGFGVLEYHALAVDWWDDHVARNVPIIDDGYVHVPEAAGLGVQLDETVVREHAKGDGPLCD
jgi:gluconate/galactonate dehydratase